MNLSLANVKRVVLGIASAKRLSYSAQPSVSVNVGLQTVQSGASVAHSAV